MRESLGFHTEMILPFSEQGLSKQIQHKAKNNQYLSFTNGLVGRDLFSGLGFFQMDSVPFPLSRCIAFCVFRALRPSVFFLSMDR